MMDSVSAATSDVSNDDIIEINAGGKFISVLRSTLYVVAPNKKFAYMFSGRWEGTLIRDDNGRVFLDHDSQLIKII